MLRLTLVNAEMINNLHETTNFQVCNVDVFKVYILRFSYSTFTH